MKEEGKKEEREGKREGGKERGKGKDKDDTGKGTNSSAPVPPQLTSSLTAECLWQETPSTVVS